jgi:asparagine synthase (glutamine-hydrolysing)
MCGIYGFTGSFNNSKCMLDIMGNEQIHRGPDDMGEYINADVALGMRRLSIIDLKNGKQPFFSEDRSIVVICNGEIYNYIEIRRDLELKGYQFKTESDIEVLPFLYQEYGTEFVQLLNGMFAIAIYDKIKDQILLIRDRLGIKPLYYCVNEGNLFFSSELKSILALDIVDKELNYGALSNYLELLYIPTPFTPFRNISKLESGSIMKWGGGRLKIEKYWDPKLIIETKSNSEESLMGEIEELLLDSSKLEVRSDVPVGSFLSGGVDSSAVTAFASRYSSSPLETFHIDWCGVHGKLDEKKFAQLVADKYKTEHHIKGISDSDLLRELPKMIWHLDEPHADGAFVPTFGLSLIAARKVKVILSGAGGDELFGGYSHHLRPSLLKSALMTLLYRRTPRSSYYDIWKPKDWRRWRSFFKWFEGSSEKKQFDVKFNENMLLDPQNAIMISDFQHYLPDDILMLTDKMTMAASLECRVPLLDHRLVELSLKIPSNLKINKKGGKVIFKKMLERYLPNEVLYRPKEGFGAPIGKWVEDNKKNLFDQVFKSSFLLDTHMMDAASFKRLNSGNFEKPSVSWMYWKILILEIWCQLFLGGRKHDEIFKS